jgi:hypothetical protein
MVCERVAVAVGCDVVSVEKPDRVTVLVYRGSVVSIVGKPLGSVGGCSIMVDVFDRLRSEFSCSAVVEVTAHTRS